MFAQIKYFINMTKPRIVGMVLVTAAMGYIMASGGKGDIGLLILTLCGTALATGGAAVLNNYLERDIDKCMERTRERPLAKGLVDPNHALTFGILLVLFGVICLGIIVNLLTSFLVLLAAFLYVLVYTPMKKITWWNTSIGALPGAIPPMVGCAAATGEIGVMSWILFLILFTWQHPHFYSIAWILRDDYRRGGFAMLPVIDTEGKRTIRHMLGFIIALFVASLLPVFWGYRESFYVFGVVILGGIFWWTGIRFLTHRNEKEARLVFRFSLVYLPAYLILVYHSV